MSFILEIPFQQYTRRKKQTKKEVIKIFTTILFTKGKKIHSKKYNKKAMKFNTA